MSLLSQDCSLLLYPCLGCTCLISAFVVSSGLVVALPPPLPLAQLKNINSGNLPLQIRRKMYQAYLVGPSVASVVDSSSKRSSVFYTERSNVVSFLWNMSGPPLCQNYKARNLEEADTIISSVSIYSCNAQLHRF